MLCSHEGEPVPQVTFRMFSKEGWYTLSTAQLFDHKTVVAFAVPGAFTCPYSPVQLLGYNEYALAFRANGVDEIICIAVNDPFALMSWAKAEKADQVRFIPDVRGEFTQELGMMVNLSDKGMGQRSWRYSMLVRDGIIEKMFIEPEGLETLPMVSNAETLLNYINPKAERPAQTVALMQMWQALLSA